jgi:CRP/FNR family transcriptional regulator, cyclic AMP receptor protein
MGNNAELLKKLDIFNGLSDAEIEKIAQLCQIIPYKMGELILEKNSPAENFYVVKSGTVSVIVNPEESPDRPKLGGLYQLSLGKGQNFGEMGLVDEGLRSATVKAETDTEVFSINRKELLALCQHDLHLGYLIMRNIAADLSFKMRYHNLI